MYTFIKENYDIKELGKSFTYLKNEQMTYIRNFETSTAKSSMNENPLFNSSHREHIKLPLRIMYCFKTEQWRQKLQVTLDKKCTCILFKTHYFIAIGWITMDILQSQWTNSIKQVIHCRNVLLNTGKKIEDRQIQIKYALIDHIPFINLHWNVFQFLSNYFIIVLHK